MLMPIAVTLWYMSMDLVPFFNNGDYNWELRRLVSLYFGLAMTLLGFWVDVRSRHSKDYAFWLYLFGVLTFWCGLSLIGLGIIWLGVIWQRHEAGWSAQLRAFLPAALRELVEARAR